jgi:hypothetical protein
LLIDPWFREAGPTTALQPLSAATVMAATKLLSPTLMHDVLCGRIVTYQPAGQFSITYSRHAGDTGYYRKLPRRNFGDSICPYLRPPTEIL